MIPSNKSYSFVSPDHMPYMVMVLKQPRGTGEKPTLEKVMMPPVAEQNKRGLLNPPWVVRVRHGNTPWLEMLMELRSPVSVGVKLEDGEAPNIDLEVWHGYTHGVSRQHMTLSPTSDQIHVEDSGSTNGTSLNGHRLEVSRLYRLRPGDELTLGRLGLRFLYIERPNTSAEPDRKVTKQLKDTGWLE